MKKIVVITIVLMLMMFGCSGNEANSTNDATVKDELFTTETLSEYNGQDGMPAYIAVDGVVYDVTNVSEWQSPHAGKFKPGKDYTAELKDAPHGMERLKGVPIVGHYE